MCDELRCARLADSTRSAVFNATRSLQLGQGWPLQDDPVLVVLDGDDWLFDESSLWTVAAYYARTGCWVTHGSFVEFPSENYILWQRQLQVATVDTQHYNRVFLMITTTYSSSCAGVGCGRSHSKAGRLGDQPSQDIQAQPVRAHQPRALEAGRALSAIRCRLGSHVSCVGNGRTQG